jgi:hypothetical protein
MDMIYKAVFCEKAKEYKKLLELSEKDNLRRTLYAEVLVSVSAFEKHVAEDIKAKAKRQLFLFYYKSLILSWIILEKEVNLQSNSKNLKPDEQ